MKRKVICPLCKKTFKDAAARGIHFREKHSGKKDIRKGHSGVKEAMKLLPETFSLEEFREMFYSHEDIDTGRELARFALGNYLHNGLLIRVYPDKFQVKEWITADLDRKQR